MPPLSDKQVAQLIVIERVDACISILGTLFILTSYLRYKRLQTLPNTLIFLASPANLFSNIAALIGGSGLSKLHGALCQFQGFLLEMFMQSDPMWSFCMAINVYLVFFHHYTNDQLKSVFKYYFLLCYGLPFIPALFCLLYKNRKKGEMYGNATLWCWIDNSWAAIRIYSYYVPIWCCIVGTLSIYTFVGFEVYRKRSELYQFNSHAMSSAVSRPEDGLMAFRTTEFKVTHESSSVSNPAQAHTRSTQGGENYTTITSNADKQRPFTCTTSTQGSVAKWFTKLKPKNMDRVKWQYTLCAVLFASSILITWVPASINRIWGLRYPSDPSFVLNVMSAMVLPLQGFWNCIIYCFMSRGILQNIWNDHRAQWTGRQALQPTQGIHLTPVRQGPVGDSFGRGVNRYPEKDSDSTRELGDTSPEISRVQSRDGDVSM